MSPTMTPKHRPKVPNMTPKWSQNVTQMFPKWSQNDPKSRPGRTLKTLISHGGYCKNQGLGPSRGIQNVFKNSFENSSKFGWVLGAFWDPIWAFKIDPKVIENPIKKSLIFSSILASILGARLPPRSHQNFIFLMLF